MALAHHNLVAWQRADDLFIDVHRLTLQRLPGHERYELGAQLRKAAFSVPANVVEGIARRSDGDTIRFLNIASASLSEVGYGLHAARRLGYLTVAEYEHFEQKVRMISGPLHGLLRRHRIEGGLIATGKAVVAILALAGLFA
jgi:four helix bundle protein